MIYVRGWAGTVQRVSSSSAISVTEWRTDAREGTRVVSGGEAGCGGDGWEGSVSLGWRVSRVSLELLCSFGGSRREEERKEGYY